MRYTLGAGAGPRARAPRRPGARPGAVLELRHQRHRGLLLGRLQGAAGVHRGGRLRDPLLPLHGRPHDRHNARLRRQPLVLRPRGRGLLHAGRGLRGAKTNVTNFVITKTQHSLNSLSDNLIKQTIHILFEFSGDAERDGDAGRESAQGRDT